MKTDLTHILTAAVLLSGVASPLLAQQSDKLPATPAVPVPASGEKLQQLGNQPADEKTASEVREALAQLINASTTEGQFTGMVGMLTKPDRDRIGDMPREKFDDLNKVIAEFRLNFKAKYQQDFSFKPEHLKNADINAGQTKEVVTVSLSDLEKNPAVNPSTAGRGEVAPKGEPAKDIPAKTGLSVVSGPSIHLVNESRPLPNWKIDIPNEIGGRQLKASLIRQLQKISDQKTTWSADADATRRAAATAVLQALNDASVAIDE